MSGHDPIDDIEQTGYGTTTWPYRPTGIGLALLGLLAAGVAITLPSGELQEILVAFAGVGLFGSLLVYFLRPSATAEIDPTERIYAALSSNAQALSEDVDLSDRHVYAPMKDGKDGFAPVALHVPDNDHEQDPIDRNRRPVFDGETMTDPDSVTGVTLYPTGGALFDAFEGLVVSELSDDPVELATQLSDGIRQGMTLVEGINIEVDGEAGIATAEVHGPRFGPLTQFDHPVPSFLAVGFVVALGVSVQTHCEQANTDRTYRVTCQWEPGSDDAED